MRRSTVVVALCLTFLLSGCAALEKRLDAEGRAGCLDCESKCWPPGRLAWTNKCLCEPWVEECESTKLPFCSPCNPRDEPEAEDDPGHHDAPETSDTAP